MIPSQQPMMLDAALAFENIIKNPKAGAKTTNEVNEVHVGWGVWYSCISAHFDVGTSLV